MSIAEAIIALSQLKAWLRFNTIPSDKIANECMALDMAISALAAVKVKS